MSDAFLPTPGESIIAPLLQARSASWDPLRALFLCSCVHSSSARPWPGLVWIMHVLPVGSPQSQAGEGWGRRRLSGQTMEQGPMGAEPQTPKSSQRSGRESFLEEVISGMWR